MANGRFISNTLGASHKFSALTNDTHRVMYVLLITHTDVEGRLDADPRVLNGRAFTLMGWTTDQVQAGLVALAAAKLIHLYQLDGRQYAEIVDFHKHNKVRKDREKASDIPARDSKGAAPIPHTRGSPPGALPEPAGSSPQQVQVQVQVQDQVQETHSSNSKTNQPPTLAATPPRTHHDPGQFMEAWNQHRGRLPAVTALNTKRRTAIRALVKEHGPDTALDLLRDATRAVATDDFWLQRQYGFDNLLTGGKVLSRAEQWRAGAHQLGEGNIRLATNVDRWAKALPPDPVEAN